MIQGFCGNAESRDNRPAKVIGAGINTVKGCSRPKINNDQRTFILFNGGNRIDDPVRTNLTGVLIP
ncbi:hypothetical protein D3C75_1329090 [compost metagenome]